MVGRIGASGAPGAATGGRRRARSARRAGCGEGSGCRPPRLLAAAAGVLAAAAAAVRGTGGPLANVTKMGIPVNAPVAIRPRTRRLYDANHLPKEVNKLVMPSLDAFQRLYPQAEIEEAKLIARWEYIAQTLGGYEVANDVCTRHPLLLVRPKRHTETAFHWLTLYLGKRAARRVVLNSPEVIGRSLRRLKDGLPAVLNVVGSKAKLAAVIEESPKILEAPIGDFYRLMHHMVSVTGTPAEATELAQPAWERLRKTTNRAVVPKCYPALIAIMGGFEEAHAAIEEQPLLLWEEGEYFLEVLYALRKELGRKAAQVVARKAPYLFVAEKPKDKVKTIYDSFKALLLVFSVEEAQRLVLEQPELLTLGISLSRVVRFATRKLGSKEAVREDFEGVLRKSGLRDHLENWEKKRQPRLGQFRATHKWTTGNPERYSPWAPENDPEGHSSRQPWQEEEGFVEAKVLEFQDKELPAREPAGHIGGT